MKATKRVWTWCLLLSVVCLCFCCGACNRRQKTSGTAGTQAQPTDTLTVMLGAAPANLDPALISDLDSATVAAQVYEGLVMLEPGSVRVAPALAQRWDVSPDGLRLTFHLKPGVVFHDGTPCDADAVKFSLLRQCDPNHPHHLAGRMRFARMLFGDPSSTETELVRDVSAPDPNTVVIELARPFAPFLRHLAMVQAAVVSPSAVQTLGDDFNTTMVGAGPFRLLSSRAGVMVLGRNEIYHGAPPPLREVRFRFVSDVGARAAALRRGEADIVGGLDGRARETVRSVRDARLSDATAMTLGYIALNCARPPLDNRLVRQALTAALDAAQIVESAMGPAFEPAAGLLPPGMTGHDPARKPAVGDPARARQLLAEGGYPNGFTVALATPMRSRIYCTEPARLAARIREDLMRIGVTVRIEEKDTNTFAEAMKTRDYQMALTGWMADTGDPEDYLRRLAGQPDNEQTYVSPGVGQLMSQALTVSDETAREALYRKVEVLVLAEAPVIPLSHALQPFGLRGRVKGFEYPPLLVPRLAGVRVE